MSPLDKLRLLLGKKASYYRAVFNPETVAAKEVMADLASFCRAHEPTFHPDPRMNALLEGRREVWLRIQNYAKLNNEDLLALRIAALEQKKDPGA